MKRGRSGLWSVCVLGGLGAGLAGCGQNDAVARVGSETITAADLRRFVSQLSEGLRAEGSSMQARREYLQALIDRQLLLMDARARGLDTTSAVRHKVREAVDARASHLYYTRNIASHVEVTPEDVRRYFADTGFDRERQLWAIRTDTRGEILEVEKRLEAGADFADEARAHSTDVRSAERGGLLGFVGLDVAERLGVPADLFTSLPTGQLSPPLQVDDDWHVFRFADDRPAEFSRYRNLIESRLRKTQGRRLFDEHVDQLRVDLEVAVDHDGIGRVVAAVRRRDLADLEGSPEPVFTYVGGSITLDEVRRRLRGRRDLTLLTDPHRATEILSDVILTPRLFAVAARQAGIYDEEEVQVLRRRTEEDALLEAVRRELVSRHVQVTEEDARQYYETHESVFLHEDAVWLDELLLGSQEEAKRAFAALAGGAPFAEYAARSLRSGSVADGARYHLHPRERGLYPVLVPAAMAAPVGQLQGPLQVRGGWSVFRVVRHEEGRMEPWDSARERALALVRRRREDERFQEVVRRLREQYASRVEIYANRLAEALPESLLIGARTPVTATGTSRES